MEEKENIDLGNLIKQMKQYFFIQILFSIQIEYYFILYIFFMIKVDIYREFVNIHYELNPYLLASGSIAYNQVEISFFFHIFSI